eukprot:gene1843-985_t
MSSYFESLKPHLEEAKKYISESTVAKVSLGSLASVSSLYVYTNYIHPWINTTPQGFNSKSTADDVVKELDLSGKVFIITGSNTGIGKETAIVLASKGAHVILSGRDEEKLKKTKNEILKKYKDAIIDFIPVDLGDKESVKKFVEIFKALKIDLHYLILNAGILFPMDKIVKTKDGFESHFGVNHLGHYRLTMQLLPFMKSTKGERRIVVLSSDLYSFVKEFRFDDYEMIKEKSYSGMIPRYSQSKLANVLFAVKLNKKLKNDEINIQVNACHPGIIRTEIGRSNSTGFFDSLFSKMIEEPLRFFMGRSIHQGAATTVYTAVHPSMKEKGGFYLENCQIKPFTSAVTDEAADKLWKLSEELTGEKYPF